MAEPGTLTSRILDAVRSTPDCTLDELTSTCPDLHWNQVFLEVDRLSRSGELRLSARGLGHYAISLQAAEQDQTPLLT